MNKPMKTQQKLTSYSGRIIAKIARDVEQSAARKREVMRAALAALQKIDERIEEEEIERATAAIRGQEPVPSDEMNALIDEWAERYWTVKVEVFGEEDEDEAEGENEGEGEARPKPQNAPEK